MKKDIHPKYFPKAKATCSCGASFEVGSTQEEIKTEICSNCHPFYTGNAKFIDSAGRVDKFKERLAKKEQMSAKKAVKPVKSEEETPKETSEEPK